MTLGKSFQTLSIFVVIPLMLAVHADKLSLSAAMDIIVWYIAVSFGIFIFKTPIRLYFMVLEKTKLLTEKKEFYESQIGGSYQQHQEMVKKHLLILHNLEWKLLTCSIGCPFFALATWYCLEIICDKYSLSSLSQLLHPYFIIIAGVVSCYQPIFYFLDHFKSRLDDIYYVHPQSFYAPSTPSLSTPPPPTSIEQQQQQQQQQEEIYEQIILKQLTEMYTNEKVKSLIQKEIKSAIELQSTQWKEQQQQQLLSIAKQHQMEIKKIKKELTEWSNRRNYDLSSIDSKVESFESRLLKLENQIEYSVLQSLHTNSNNPKPSIYQSSSSDGNKVLSSYDEEQTTTKKSKKPSTSLISTLFHIPTRIIFGNGE